MIAVDSSVLLDILAEDPQFAAASADAIAEALAAGGLVVCDAVVAEVQAMLATSDSTMDTLNEFGIHYLPTTEQAAVRAGFMQRRFRDRGGRRERVVADFLIGAHALVGGHRLLTRDAARYRSYFPDLDIVSPETHP